MISIKILISLIMVFSGAIAASAQKQTPKIIWNDLQAKYETYRDIKPQLQLQDAKFIFWKNIPKYTPLFRFDEEKQEWIQGRYILQCALGKNFRSLLLKKMKPQALSLYIYTSIKPDYSINENRKKMLYFVSSDGERYAVNGKYKIRFYYGFEPEKLESYSDSPEFMIEGNYSSID